VIGEIVSQRGTTLVRRLILAPGEATPWHVDPYDRVSVVVRGDVLAIEFLDGRETERVQVMPGEAGWDKPTDQVHRAVNVGRATYEEVTVFFLDRPESIAQPELRRDA
jgi:quercetin dioxygenase-like cupin family protein